MGVGWGFQRTTELEEPLHQEKKSNTFTGHWSREQTVQEENKATEKSKSKPDHQSPKKIGN